MVLSSPSTVGCSTGSHGPDLGFRLVGSMRKLNHKMRTDMTMRRTRWIFALLTMACALCLQACSDATEPDPDPNPCPPPCLEADAMATRAIQALSEQLEEAVDSEEFDTFESLDFSSVRDSMDAAMDLDPQSRAANLGSALLDVLEVNYDQTLWDLIDGARELADDFDDAVGPPSPLLGIHLDKKSPILGNQFLLLATAPLEIPRLSAAGLPTNATVGTAQHLIRSVVIPALDSALAHLAIAEVVEGESGLVIYLRVDEDDVEIDLGDVLIFDASLLAARAGFKIATAYDMDLPGRDGSNDWLNELDALDDGCETSWYFREADPDSSYAHEWVEESFWKSEAQQESLLVNILQYNLDNNASFLRLEQGGLGTAMDDLRGAQEKLVEGVAVIRAEENDQTNDVVKILDLMDIDEEIEGENDKPAFAEGFTTIEDLLAWIDEVLNGTYHVVWSEDPLVEFDIDLPGFMANPPQELSDLLPFYEVKDEGLAWIDVVDQYEWSYRVQVGEKYCLRDCNWEETADCRTDVGREVYIDRYTEFHGLDFLDARNGNIIDLEDEGFPYFADYSFGGLFPGMTRQDWIRLSDVEGWW